MLRGTVPAVVLAVLLAPAATPAQQTFTIKLKKTEQGDVLTLDRHGNNAMHVKLTDPDGKTVQENDQKGAEQFSYRDTVLQKKPADRVPTKLSREYSKARLTQGGQTQTLPYEGKTVLIEKKDDRYQFRIKDGDELTGPVAADLDKEFNNPNSGKVEDEHFLPKKPVAVGETWKIDTAPLVKDFQSSVPFGVDAAGATATGKLLRTYQRGGRRFGVMAIQIKMPLTGFKAGGAKVTFKKGARALVDVTLDVCIDGTAETGEMKLAMKFDSTGTLTGPDGKDYTMTIAASGEQKETRQPGGK